MANEVRVRVIAEDRASKPIGDIKQEAGGLGGVFQSAQRNWLALTGALAATYGAQKAIGSLISAASDLEESINKNRVVFKDASGSVEAFADTSARAFGLSKNEALAATGAFGNMFNTIGLLPDAAATMSVSMTKLAADMASFNNEDPSEMLLRLRSGLAGEAEPLRRFGVLLSEAETKAFAYSRGIAEVGAKLTEAQKVQARYGLILEQTAVQQGDFERTSDSLANQQRILNAQLADMRAELGAKLLPAMTSIVQFINEGVIPAFDAWGRGIDNVGRKFSELADKIPGGDSGGSAVGHTLRSLFGLDQLEEIGDFLGWATGATGGPPAFVQPPTAGVGEALGVAEFLADQTDLTSWGQDFKQLLADILPSADDFTTGTAGGGGLAALRLAEEARAKAAEDAEAALKKLNAESKKTPPLLEQVRDIIERTGRAAEETANRQLNELVEAYIRGGDEAVEEVRATQSELSAEWDTLSEELREKFGVLIPEEFRGMFDSIKAQAREAREAVERERAATELAWLKGNIAAQQAFGPGYGQVIGAASGGFSIGGFFTPESFAQSLANKLDAGVITPQQFAEILAQGLEQLSITVNIGDQAVTDVVVDATHKAQSQGLLT